MDYIHSLSWLVMATVSSLTWDTRNGKYKYGASGITEVLLITSNPTIQDDDVVPRKPGGELTDDDRRRLEHQGVPRDSHHDDLSIMKARFILDKEKSMAKELNDDGSSLTCVQVTKKISQLLNNTDTNGGELTIQYIIIIVHVLLTLLRIVILYYIGPGKKGTGDWCFSDGFISFRDIMQLYTYRTYTSKESYFIS